MTTLGDIFDFGPPSGYSFADAVVQAMRMAPVPDGECHDEHGVELYLIRALHIAASAFRLGLDPTEVEPSWCKVEDIVRASDDLKLDALLQVPLGDQLYGDVSQISEWF